jgi:hypothetical protein
VPASGPIQRHISRSSTHAHPRRPRVHLKPTKGRSWVTGSENEPIREAQGDRRAIAMIPLEDATRSPRSSSALRTRRTCSVVLPSRGPRVAPEQPFATAWSVSTLAVSALGKVRPFGGSLLLPSASKAEFGSVLRTSDAVPPGALLAAGAKVRAARRPPGRASPRSGIGFVRGQPEDLSMAVDTSFGTALASLQSRDLRGGVQLVGFYALGARGSRVGERRICYADSACRRATVAACVVARCL